MTHATGKKQPVRVFLDADTYSRYLVQAGTHQVTPSGLGELLVQDGLERLEGGDLTALGLDAAPQAAVPAAPGRSQGSEL
ncbi:hypothetical protein [Halomonas sp. PBN3]|uniref:hypothetical protein n=1 Tax=Halomonas sp. PBN3 TaxID=1397528 RepID=UPI0003B7EE06|nr:hypothetical protein [Halomonas sp. PBN3]ERS92015.1 hypothetical protein Q671_14320 [Halomonas sp. PBN3]